MARVWGAQQFGQRGFSKVVAIKTIIPSLAADPQFETMFLDEARVASGVHHPNACEIFDLGEDQGVLYLAMEWVNGESLARLVKVKPPEGGKPVPKRLNPRAAARIIADAAAGLHAAHELCNHKGERLDVVHRDVSPQNILVGIDGTVKVTDFGVAKALGSSSEQTTAGQIKGKAAYMSPEQAAGARVDRRSDIFALGICLYEAGTGHRPFAGENQLATLKQVIECRYDAPSKMFSGYPPGLEAITLRAMSPDPMQRFPTAERMQHALEEWIAQSGRVVTRAQIGSVVRERAGHIVEERQRRIREAMENAAAVSAMAPMSVGPGESSVTGPESQGSATLSAPNRGSLPSISGVSGVTAASQPTSTSAPGSRTPPPQVTSTPPPGKANALVFGAVLVAAAVLLAGGAFVFKDQLFGPSPAPEGATVPNTPAPTADLVTIETEPANGVVLKLDGVELAPGVRTIERLGFGESGTLTVEADGYQARSIRIDSQAPDAITVKLEKQDDPEPTIEPEKVATPPTPAHKPAPRPNPVKKPPAAPVEPDIPDNPF